MIAVKPKVTTTCHIALDHHTHSGEIEPSFLFVDKSAIKRFMYTIFHCLFLEKIFVCLGKEILGRL